MKRLILSVFGVLALALADKTGGGFGLNIAGLAVGALLLLRGAFGYSRWWAERMPVEPFHTANRKTYSPLAIALGAGFIILVILRLL